MRKLIVQFKSTRRMTMSDAYWATNKVAAMKLARDIIYNTPFEGAVPEVYSWYEGTDRPGDKAWVIQSAPPSDSVPLKSRFNREHEQKDILDHIAKLQRYFQAYKMPRSYGSCSFTSTGQVCAGPLQQPNLGGPFTTSRDMMKAELRRDFSRAKRHHELQGWTCEPELRQQLAEFIAHSMNTMLSTIQDCDPIFTLNKLELSNFLCDKYGGRINYIIDFSWASITHPIMEFFNSYVTMFGVLPFFPNENWAILHRAVLNGFEKKHVDVDLRGLDFLAYIQEIRDPAESYRIGRELYEAFEKAKVKTPREIKGAEAMSAFMGLCAAVGARSWSPPGASPEDVYQAKVKNLTDSLREVRKWAN
ncbi:hypothetical protein BO94DRAFT_498721 [Aspergillus sclerotioniger CBS 115572]|uniref:Uncharacterized protein n=1 Tax=Aspergillus sclerotioniger CBS 115572 TaxID=1450535 RepID=A0A317VV98_9EURO|nr:hypothetical protein BO94DRAFT_498721 [Aspergillus sclerotioniger CBS 115572]PWY77281.1 hypothetical protein BO94DRAFT_498721 [Aspergillus sclerotioniger CBS 115572]